MSIIDITEQIESEVDMNAEFNSRGLRVSVFVDEAEISQHVDYDLMAWMMIEDDVKYNDAHLAKITDGLRHMVKILEDALDDGRE